MSEWLDICHINDLQADSGVCALVKEQQVALFYLVEEQKVYAINNYDPFGKIYVLSRGLIGDIKGEPMVASPLYKQHFSLKTGQCFEDENVKVPTYSARIKGERVEVNLDRNAA